MDHISREKWDELNKWLDISQLFYDAYTSFCTEGKSVHCFRINHRSIEVVFSCESSCFGISTVVKTYCPDSGVRFCEEFYPEKEKFNDEEEKSKLIISEIYGLAWGSLSPEVFRVTTDDSDDTYDQLDEILSAKTHQSIDAYIDRSCSFGFDSADCIIELYGRQIYVFSQVDYWDESYIDFWFDCIDTNRSLHSLVDYGEPLENAIQKILYLALEPECLKISTTDIRWEYELIKAVVVHAINICPYACDSGKEAEERLIELHNRQIRIRLKSNRTSSVDAFLDCLTTGRSRNCVVREYDKNPEEMIWDILELAWEEV